MHALLLLLAALILSTCASSEQLAAADDATCRSYGAVPGTDAYIQCRMQQDSTRRAERQHAIESMSETLDDMRRSLRQTENREINCRTSRTGIFTDTTCR